MELFPEPQNKSSSAKSTETEGDVANPVARVDKGMSLAEEAAYVRALSLNYALPANGRSGDERPVFKSERLYP